MKHTRARLSVGSEAMKDARMQEWTHSLQASQSARQLPEKMSIKQHIVHLELKTERVNAAKMAAE